jgi:hypothetical protein
VVCPDPATGEACMTLTRDDFRAVARDAGGTVHRVLGLRLARIATQIGDWKQHGTPGLLWKIPLRTAGPDDTREIVLCDVADEQIVGVEGTRWTARSDTRVAIERAAPDAAASIAVRTLIADKFEAGVPPMPFELREREVGVLQERPPPEAHGSPDG